MRHPAAVLTFACALALGTAACADDDGPVSPLTGDPAATADGVGAAPEDDATGGPLLADFTPRTVAYLNADITVNAVEVSRTTPDTYGDAAPRTGDTTYAYLDVTVANRLNHTNLLINDEVFLELPDGTSLPFTGRSEVVRPISAGATATGWYAFELPADADLVGATLVLGEPGHRQERLPLIGDVPEPEYPTTISVDSPGTVLTRNGCPLEVEVTEAVLGHWIGFDEDGRSYTTGQATADRLMLLLRLAVTAPAGSGQCFIGTASGGDVHLIVDGERRSEIPVLNTTTNVQEGATARQFLIYDIPADAQVQIEWGRLGGEQTRIPVPLP